MFLDGDLGVALSGTVTLWAISGGLALVTGLILAQRFGESWEKSMKKIMFYCQHVLGMGHFIRAMEITRGLRNFKIRFLNGGEIVSGFACPPWVEVVHLPAVKPDADLKYIEPVDASRSLDELKESRKRALLFEFERFKPDLLIIELFPFARRQFVFELLPLLARIRHRGRSTKVVCSVRDILVSQPDQAQHEEWVCTLLNRYFDLILVHSDPNFQRLEETFSRALDISTEIRYTGYVVQSAEADLSGMDDTDVVRQVGESIIVVSIGGGRVGYELLACAVEASGILGEVQPHRIVVFTGPFLPEERFWELKRMVELRPNITLRRYTHRFLSYLKQADLSISMAGYNTCMNLLTTGCRALVLPFATPGNDEQTIRANKLEALGVLNVIRPHELRPDALAHKILACLKTKPASHTLNLRGVENTATFLTELVGEEHSAGPAAVRPLSDAHSDDHGPQTEVEVLRQQLEQFQAQNKEVNIFLRDDDVGEDERGLRQLLNLALSRSVPLNLEIIPGILTDSTVTLLERYKHFCPTLLELNQHGYRHHNYELRGRKSEFGMSRSFDQQLEDVEMGKKVLERIFHGRFHPVFTPPWNRCTEDTLKVVDQLGFRVLSRHRSEARSTGYRFREIPVTLDLYRWKGAVTMRPREEILRHMVCQMRDGHTIGILLHHQVMDPEAFSFLEGLLDELTVYPVVRFHTYQSLVGSIT